MGSMGRFFKTLFQTYNKVFILTGLFFILIAVAIYFLLGKQAADVLIEQMLHREQTVARSGANSIEVFFNLYGKAVSFLGETPEIINYNTGTGTELTNFFNRWSNTPVEGIGLTDENGVFVYFANKKNESSIGIDVSEREYFKWAKSAKRGDLFVGVPVRAKTGGIEGQYIIPLATPVLDPQGKFKGVLIAGVLTSDLVELYKSSQNK
jgi:hypothetical protein